MKNYIYTIFFLFLSHNYAVAQTPTNIIKENNYTIDSNSGNITLTALQSITLKPDTWIKSGSTFTAQVLSNATTPLMLSNENYIHTITPRIAITDVSGLANNEKIETVAYFDGLGRAIQSIAIRAGGNSEDIITHIEYDNLGRQNKSYLPYTIGTNGGAYKTDALTATNNFYNTAKYENTTNPYSETLFDGTPLNLVIEQAAPGNDWKQGISDEHTIKNEYKLIETNDYVRNYKINNSNGTLVDNGYFAIGEVTTQGAFNTPNIFKFITKNENWVTGDLNDNTTHTFKDYRGRVILNRTFENQVKHDTYYVYDPYGNLVYVLPPKADPSSAIPDATELSELCFQYKYDDKNRLIEKKIPGKGWEYIVYNKLDQPVLTQDSALDAQGKWIFTKYDRFGRVAYTGITNNTNSRSALQTTLDATSSTYVTKSTSSISLGGATLHYNNSAYPTSIAEIHTVNYYDDYTFDKDGLSLPSSYEGQTIINYNDTNKLLTNGLATGTKIRILDNSNPTKWITTITGYDVKGRAIYIANKNQYLNNTDIIKSKLNFVGAADKTETSHTKGTTNVDTEDLFTYDHMSRLNTQTQELNSSNIIEVIVDNTYDELGKLIGKGVGGKTTQSRLQSLDYTYNIRGWLKSINNVASLGTDLFGFKINYNTIGHHSGNDKKLYNGIISEIEWKTSNNNVLRWYKYEYDDLNRIISAQDDIDRYSISGIQYDPNGNIKNLTRKGHIFANPVSINSSHFGNMDVLTYDYLPKTNKLSIVSDAANDTYGFKDDQIGSGTDTTTDYTYDINGNMSTDTNKGITAIVYNHLNLPTQVSLGSENISYIYNALGTKLSKTVSTSGIVTSYAGNYVYEGSSLKFFNHAEGYVEQDGSGGYDYVYQFTDHLGNIRLSYKDISSTSTPNLQIQEENNYYPFGLKHKGYNGGVIGNDHKYGFGGKEEQDDNINGNKLDWLDFHARNYDAALGRWMNLDPLADSEMQFSQSPYTYTWNNPVNLTDFSGMHPDWFEGDGFGGYYEFGEGASLSFDGNSFNASGSIGNRDKETPVQKVARKAITSVANKANESSGGMMAQSASDSDVNAYQLFYQWVHGTGSDSRNFDENSVMGKQMLKAPEVMDAMSIAAQQAACEDNCGTVAFFRSLRSENPITYALDDFPKDIDGRNPARGFHGSFSGTITMSGRTKVEGGYMIHMTVNIRDRMTATSGTRASGTAGGYDKNNPLAVYPTANPYGPKGQFRTININYSMNVQYFQPTDK